jgi:hypothetical protein
MLLSVAFLATLLKALQVAAHYTMSRKATEETVRPVFTHMHRFIYA